MTLSQLFSDVYPVALDAIQIVENPTSSSEAQADAIGKVTTALTNSGHPLAAQLAAVAPTLIPAVVQIAQHPNPAALISTLPGLFSLFSSFKF